MSEYVLNFDGSCGPKNPGPNAGWGFTVKRDGKLFHTSSGELSGAIFTNNYSEFYALYEGLKLLKQHVVPSDKIFIRGDSQLVIKVMRGTWKVKGGLYYPAYVLAQTELTCIRAAKNYVSLDWVPREMNTEADALSTAYSNTSGEKR